MQTERNQTSTFHLDTALQLVCNVEVTLESAIHVAMSTNGKLVRAVKNRKYHRYGIKATIQCQDK